MPNAELIHDKRIKGGVWRHTAKIDDHHWITCDVREDCISQWLCHIHCGRKHGDIAGHFDGGLDHPDKPFLKPASLFLIAAR